MENEGAVTEVERQIICSICTVGVALQQRSRVIAKREMEDLEGKVVYLMRKVVGEKVRKEKEDERMSNQQLREMLGIESVERMIRKRRFQWVAHSARRGQGDFTWKGMMRKLEDEESGWGEQIRNDWNELEVEVIDQWTKLVENKGWLSRMLRSGGDVGSEATTQLTNDKAIHYYCVERSW